MSSAATNRGVQICVESLNEFKIKEIGYDGVEHYIKPPKFKDLIAKNANSIIWRDIVGAEASLDDRTADRDEDDDEVEIGDDDEQRREREMAEKPTTSLSKAVHSLEVEPAAGPWSGVAKHLHRSLHEVNMLLDVVRLVRMGSSSVAEPPKPIYHYLKPKEISTHPEGEKLLYELKNFQFCARKKAVGCMSKAIEAAANARCDDDKRGLASGKAKFYEELKKMRERWRIRKVGNVVYGDLGYRIYGHRFMPNEIFDIMRDPSQNITNKANFSCLSVQVPRDLERRTMLCVFILTDTSENKSNFFSHDFDRVLRKAKDSQSRGIHWERALKWAQNSLICKDIFTQLVKESVTYERICFASDNYLLVSLYQNYYLKIERRFYPFEDAEIPEAGIPYLNRVLQELFILEQARKKNRPQAFVSLPLSALPESVDMRGPKAFSTEDFAVRTASKSMIFLDRFVERSIHYLTVCKTVKLLKDYSIAHPDPHIQWRWSRCSPTFTTITLTMINNVNMSLTCFIRIRGSELIVLNKDYQQINNYGKDVDALGRVLSLLAATYLASSVNMYSKIFGWQMLHMNNNALDEAGNPAPSFYACNQTSLCHLFIQFHTTGEPPSIYMKKRDRPDEKRKAVGRREEMLDLNQFSKFNYDRLLGTTFMKKIDRVLTIFSS